MSLYGRSKLAGELVLQELRGLRFTVVRSPAVYGPRDRDFLFLFKLARWGLFPILNDPASAYTLIDIHDLIDALLALPEQPAAWGEVFFVGHPDAVTQTDLGRTLMAAVGRRYRRIRVPAIVLRLLSELGELGSLVGRPGLLNRSRYRELTAPGFVCSVDKARDRLGIVAQINLHEGFAQTAAWYREQGDL